MKINSVFQFEGAYLFDLSKREKTTVQLDSRELSMRRQQEIQYGQSQ